LNPASGRGTGRARRGELEALLQRYAAGSEWQVVETSAPGHASALAAEVAVGGATIVAAAGGDGTYGEVANGIVGTSARLGIIPLGTGNDFARALGLNTDLERSVRTLFEGTPHAIDLGRTGDRYFINVAGCGFDAAVAERVNRGFRRLRGTSAYVAAVYQTLLSFRAAEMRLVLDGEIRTVRAMLCSIANTPTYGGGMKIAPDARIDDGWFDVCILAEAGRFEFMRAFPRVFKGTHVTHPKVTILRARVVSVESDRPLPVLVDGDVLDTTPAHFQIHPAAIQVMTPRDSPVHSVERERPA
jgi:diacylglycerol kinase (ATP)